MVNVFSKPLISKQITMFIFESILSVCILLILIAAFIMEIFKTKRNKLEPPTPGIQIPIIGHLYIMSRYEEPFVGFTDLSKKIGNVFTLQLGCSRCVIVNGQKNIYEALIAKGHHFDSRPNLLRYDHIFCGTKENCKNTPFKSK